MTPGKYLTKKDKVSAEQSRISRLTNHHSAHFKVIFSHQLENKFGFKSHGHNKKLGRQTSTEEAGIMFRAFGKFMDDAVRMTMTEVETKYGRVPDKRDGTFDPESGTEVPIEHYCLYENGTPGRKLVDSIRLHGYTRTNGGYFVVTRLDWFHDYHSK